MKRTNLFLAGLIVMVGFTACNGDSTSTTPSSDNTTVKAGDSNNASTTNPGTNSTMTDNQTSTSTVNKMPLSKADSMFVMEAAMGGMMEVEAGNIAQQNAASDRVKAFASMMVTDHTKANSELMSIASGRGVTPPTALPPAMQKHMDAMKKMTGKAFDKHYMSMMVNDHKKDISLFEKESTSGADGDLKTFATKTLPTLQMHRDSAVAINKMKM